MHLHGFRNAGGSLGGEIMQCTAAPRDGDGKDELSMVNLAFESCFADSFPRTAQPIPFPCTCYILLLTASVPRISRSLETSLHYQIRDATRPCSHLTVARFPHDSSKSVRRCLSAVVRSSSLNLHALPVLHSSTKSNRPFSSA